MDGSKRGRLRVDFDRCLKLEFRGVTITSAAGLLACRDLDDAVEPPQMAGDVLVDGRTGKTGRHSRGRDAQASGVSTSPSISRK